MLRRAFLLQAAAAAPGAALWPARASAQAGTTARRVNIVTTAGTTQFVLAELIKRKGYFQGVGVDAEMVSVADGAKVVAALVSGQMDICPTSGFSQVLAAIEKGAPLKILGGGAIKNFYAVFSGNPAVKTLKDIEGRTVGVGALGSQLHQSMIVLLRKYGADVSKVRFVNIGSSVDVYKAVSARIVDAGAAEIWLQRGTNLHIVEHGKLFESIPDFINQAAFASDRAIANKRDALVRTLAAYARAYRYIMSGDSRADFLAASTAALGRTAADEAGTQWSFYRQIQPFAADLILSPQQVMRMQQLNLMTGVQKRILPYEQIVDVSLARDALRLLGKT